MLQLEQWDLKSKFLVKNHWVSSSEDSCGLDLTHETFGQRVTGKPLREDPSNSEIWPPEESASHHVLFCFGPNPFQSKPFLLGLFGHALDDAGARPPGPRAPHP